MTGYYKNMSQDNSRTFFYARCLIYNEYNITYVTYQWLYNNVVRSGIVLC
jgi:hypothetical protein